MQFVTLGMIITVLVKWIVKFTNGYYVSQIVKNVC